jgi:bifunctional non-homologous end joining protein LigD
MPDPIMPLKPATRDYHPARIERAASKPKRSSKSAKRLVLPRNETNLDLEIDGRVVKLTNLGKPFWPELGITKRDLLQ